MEQSMATIQLKYLTLPKLIDAVYMCGLEREPVFVHIAGDTGIGKTFATKSIEEIPGVAYFSASYSPNEYKAHIKEIAKSTSLFIHDDVGRGNPSYTKDFISAFCDITEGHSEYRQFKKNFSADFNFSAVFTSTTGWFYSWKDVMNEMGYTDRVLVLQLELHPNTRKAYQDACIDSAIEGCLSNCPAPRPLTKFKRHSPIELYERKDINPRNLRNILRLSCYLNADEINELINVVRMDKPRYSI